jgi:hypothetical protein
MSLFLNKDIRSTLEPGYAILNHIRFSETLYTGEAIVYIEPIQNKFHSLLAIDSKKDIILHSNSFLTDYNFINNTFKGRKQYDEQHTIFTRLEMTYAHLLCEIPSVVIEEPMFMLLNTFSAVNFGHDLSILLDRIKLYKSMKLDIPVIVGDIMNSIPRSLEICKALLPDTKFYFLPSNTVVHFKYAIISQNTFFDILKNSDLIQEIIQVYNRGHIEQKFLNRKVFIVKNNDNKNVVTKDTVFNCRNTIDVLIDYYNYVYINPEKMPMNEIVLYLSNAKKIITSHGSISYGNAIFFNKSAEIFYLNTYACYDNHLCKTIYCDYNLDSCIKQFLKQIGEIVD